MKNHEMNRREFVQAAAVTGAGLALSSLRGFAQDAGAGGGDDINVAIIGTGTQGRILLKDALKIPGLRFKAVCDIWSYSQRYATRLIGKYKQEANGYQDYREMLSKEKDLDAVIIAVPDFWHAEHTIACLEAGLHVYCEKEMSNTLPRSKDMVLAARKAGKMLQIGHQRRSNPVYQYVHEMIHKDGLLGRLTNCYGQWNRPVQEKLRWPAKYEMTPDELKKYGYESMEQFRNWRWYRKYSAGPIADLGSHQIDIFSWFFGAEPNSVTAVGGGDFYADREWYEDVMTIYEYTGKQGKEGGSGRGFYQVLNTNGFGNYYETFRGTKGTVNLSENHKLCYFAAEPSAMGSLPDWLTSVEPIQFGITQVIPFINALPKKSPEAAKAIEEWNNKNVHQLHLENFFTAIRKNDPKVLTCPGEVAYPTAVAVLSAISAIEQKKKLEFKPEDYEV